MESYRKVKIVATLGPATASLDKIRYCVEAGVNVFRLNMSHGDHAIHAQSIQWIRQIEKTIDHPVGILVDLQGPKFRVGNFDSPEGVHLEAGQSFSLDLKETPGDRHRVFFPHGVVYEALEVGSTLLLNDGAIRLEVQNVTPESIETKVLVGGLLMDHKGVNIPDVDLPIEALTPKDRDDLTFALSQDIDFIGLSFVQSPEDMQQLREIVGDHAALFAKIEKPQALESLDDIIDLCDGIMVARGDLGVELSPENVPMVQKKIIRACRKSGKPVIVATQMLETMTDNPFPTRAEASDVATAVYDGADAVMLSAESAMGQYPLETIEMMGKIISSVEQDDLYLSFLAQGEENLEKHVPDAISSAARQLSYTLPAFAIVTYTATGGTARRVSHKRPKCMILGMTDSLKTSRYLTVAWGVYPSLVQDVSTFEEMTACAVSRVQSYGGTRGDHLIFTCGVPFGNPGSTNIINVQTLP